MVTLTATADAGYRVKSWSGTDDDTLKTATNTVTMDADKTVTVEFELIPTVQYDLTVTAVGSGSIMVDPPGVTFEEGTSLNITAVADPGWSFNQWTGDLNGSTNPASLIMNSDKGITAVFTETAAAGFVSDDFNACSVNYSLWSLVDPVGDASLQVVGGGSGDAQLLLTVPAGRSHDAWNVNESARLMQPAADTDFEIEVKFDSLVLERYQDQGIIVEGSASNWLRFDVYSDGSSTRIFAASVVNGSPSVKISKVITTASPIYLNVERTGNTWRLSYSYNGASWTLAGSFTHALAVTAVGPYAGNYDSGSNAPAHTALWIISSTRAVPVDTGRRCTGSRARCQRAGSGRGFRESGSGQLHLR